MNSPEHRQQGGGRVDPRLWLLAAFTVGALLAAGVVLLVQDGGDSAGTRTSPRAATVPAAPRETTTVTASPSPPASPSTGPADRIGTAQMTKPLTDLAPGDRVVYNMRLCHFERHVGGDPEVSLISCPGKASRFQVRTMTLVPVEPGGD